MARQGRQRTCSGCGGQLSRYNPGNSCRACVVGNDDGCCAKVAGDPSVHPLLIPWALPESPARRAPVPLSVVSDVRTSDRSCAAERTHDLLDCDCGYVTQSMKVQILDMLDTHAAYTRIRQRVDDDGEG